MLVLTQQKPLNFRTLNRRMINVLFIVITQLIPVCLTTSLRRNRIEMCEPIDIPLCKGMPYNMTRMPNHMHHSTQENARLAIEPYSELLKQNCSEDLLFFLCTMFAPICTPEFQKEAIPPCRAVCEKSRKGCEPVIKEHNHSWPEALNCDLLPEYDKGVCVSPEAIVSSMPEDKEFLNQRKDKKPSDCKCKDKNKNKPTKKKYRQGKYGFAIAVKVIQTRTMDDQNSFVQVTVIKVLKRGKLHIHEFRNTNLWVKSSCVCPKLKKNREYFITGYEDVILNRLIYTPTSLVARWNSRMEKRIKAWNKKTGKKKRRCRKRNGKKVCKNKQSGRKIHCRIEMSGETTSKVKCTKQSKSKKRQSNPRSSKRRKTETVTKRNKSSEIIQTQKDKDGDEKKR